MRPVLRWFGGKWILAPWIISHFPPHRIYVEPYGGAASVLMRKTKSYAEVWNDLDDSVFNLFSILKKPNQASELRRLLEFTAYSRREFDLAHIYHPDPIENARRLIVRSFMGFGADSAVTITKTTSFRSNSNRSGTTPAHDWINYPKNFDFFIDRLKGVIIEHRDAIQVMRDHDGPNVLHYVDPPYVHDQRGKHRYNYEMTHRDHEILADTLSNLQGNVVISGYESPIYNSLGWKKEIRQAYADGAKKRTECLWIKNG